MKKATQIIRSKQNLLFVACITSIVLGVFILFIGGLSYTNPKLEFSALFNLEPLKNMIFTLIPSIE